MMRELPFRAPRGTDQTGHECFNHSRCGDSLILLIQALPRIMYDTLFQVGQDGGRPAARLLPSEPTGRVTDVLPAPADGGEVPVTSFVMEHSHVQLPQLIHTVFAPRAVTGGLDGRQQ